MISIKFKDLKPFISRVDRLSICMYETMRYENFINIRNLPQKYDEYYVFGIGMIYSEFYGVSRCVYSTNPEDGELVLLPCLGLFDINYALTCL